MSRTKIAYDFAPVPRKRDPRWKNLRNVYGRHLYAELFMLTEGKPFAFAGEWDVFLCRELQIPGPQRTNFCRAFREMESVGLVTVSGTHIHVVFNEQVGSSCRAGREQVESRSRAAAVQVVSSLDSTPRNDSTRDRQTEETEETDKTYPDARARADETGGGVVPIEPVRKLEIEGFKWLESVLGTTPPDLGSWRQQYAQIAGKPAAERAAVARHVLSTAYIAERRSKATPGHLLKFWAQFVEGPRSFEFAGPTTAKRFAGPSRVATAEEYAADAAGGNDPW